MASWPKRTFLLCVKPLKGALGIRRGQSIALTRLKMAPLKIGLFRGGSGKLKNRRKDGAPTTGSNRRSSELAILEFFSIDSETPRVADAAYRARIGVAQSRPRQRARRSTPMHQRSRIPNKVLESMSPRISPVSGALRSIRKNRGSKMPNERLESTSLKVGRKRGGVNLFPFPFFCHWAFHFWGEVSSVTSATRFFA